MTAALTVMHRYAIVARAMGAEQLEVLATAAVRDASNGRALRRMGCGTGCRAS